jgi:hypothetical protein
MIRGTICVTLLLLSLGCGRKVPRPLPAVAMPGSDAALTREPAPEEGTVVQGPSAASGGNYWSTAMKPSAPGHGAP